MILRDKVHYIGKVFYDYFIQIYKESPLQKICFLLDDETFITTIKNTNPNIFTDISKIDNEIKEIFKEYNSQYSLNFLGDKYIALALVVYQVQCCTTAEALDESSIVKSIADGYDTDRQTISFQYFKSGMQKKLWEAVSELFGNKVLLPNNPIPLGRTGCNVQYPKLHRVLSSSELNRCKKMIFPYISDVDSFAAFTHYSKKMCDLLFRINLDETELFVVYKLFCYWKLHRKEEIQVNQINTKNQLELRIFIEDEAPYIINSNGELVSTLVLKSELIDDFLLFYYDTENYTSKFFADSDYIAVLLNKRNPLLEDVEDEILYTAIFADDKQSFILLFYDMNSFYSSPFFTKSGIQHHDFNFIDGIQISHNEYVKGFLPIIECNNDIKTLTVSAIGNLNYSKEIRIEDCKYNLNQLSGFLMESGFYKFKVSSPNNTRTFSIAIDKKRFEGPIGWDYSNLSPKKVE